MKGFMKRDLTLMVPTLKLYGGIFAVMLAVSLFTSMGVNFFAVYACVFTFSGVLGLFSYDEANHWQAYAAAAPGGRRGQVEARYALSFLMSAGVTLILLLAYLIRPEDRAMAGIAFLYGGLGLVYSALCLPLCYRFGVVRGRTLILMIVVISGILGAAGSVAALSGGGAEKFPAGVGLLVLAGGILVNLISRRISIRIMAAKEL